MPGGNYAKNSLNTEKDRLMFLNRGYCPTRFYEKGAERYSSRELNNYDDPQAFGYGPYSPHSHIAANNLEADYTGSNSEVCTHLNFRANEHSKVLSDWLKDHNQNHKITSAIEILDNSVVNSSKCTMSNIENAINKLEMCKKYGIGGRNSGQIYFTSQTDFKSNDDITCGKLDTDNCSKNDLCETTSIDTDTPKCQSKIGIKVRKKHGSHLFGNCTASVIFDFETMCSVLNIPIHQSETTKLFQTYRCNAKDVFNKLNYCASKGVDITFGESCDQKIIEQKLDSDFSIALANKLEASEYAKIQIMALLSEEGHSIKSLESVENLEADQVRIANQFRIEAARESAEYNKDYYLTIHQTVRKEEATKKYNKVRYCYLWNVEGPNGDKALSKQNPVKDPFYGGLNITNNKKELKN